MSPHRENRGIWSMVKVPVLITLCVSLLRLVGELLEWSEMLFGTAAGGGFALVGISWLIPVFGFWFGRRIRATQGGPNAGKVAITTVLAIVIVVGGVWGLTEAGLIVMPSTEGEPKDPDGIPYFIGMLGLGAVIALFAWPRLGVTLLVYGFLARIPVVIITYIAVHRNWDTHYIKTAPGVPPLEGTELILSLCTPQVTLWIAFTILAGTLAGTLGAATAGRSR